MILGWFVLYIKGMKGLFYNICFWFYVLKFFEYLWDILLLEGDYCYIFKKYDD